MKAALLMSLVMWGLVGLIVVFSSGCSSGTGWRFEVGVAPVKSISNTVQTAQKGASKSSAKVRKVIYVDPSDTGY